jgi:hypothetical protein
MPIPERLDLDALMYRLLIFQCPKVRIWVCAYEPADLNYISWRNVLPFGFINQPPLIVQSPRLWGLGCLHPLRPMVVKSLHGRGCSGFVDRGILRWIMGRVETSHDIYDYIYAICFADLDWYGVAWKPEYISGLTGNNIDWTLYFGCRFGAQKTVARRPTTSWSSMPEGATFRGAWSSVDAEQGVWISFMVKRSAFPRTTGATRWISCLHQVLRCPSMDLKDCKVNSVFLIDSLVKMMTVYKIVFQPLVDPVRLAVACLLKCKFGRFLSFFAIKCASWTSINAGTSNRCPCASIGFDEYASVSLSNKMLERILVQKSWTIFCFIYHIRFCLGIYICSSIVYDDDFGSIYTPIHGWNTYPLPR